MQFSMVISLGFSGSSDKSIWLYSPASKGVVGFAGGAGNKADCSLSALLPISGVSSIIPAGHKSNHTHFHRTEKPPRKTALTKLR